MKKITSAILTVFLLTFAAQAQTTEVTVSLNEQFFDTLLDAIFKNFNEPEFPLAQNASQVRVQDSEFGILDSGFEKQTVRYDAANENNLIDADNSAKISLADNRKSKIKNPAPCDETIHLKREIDGVRTAVRFRDGRITAPLAFSGSYNPPLVGCIDFQGWADTTIDLEYDRQSRKLVGRVRVEAVNLGGATNLASGLLARLVQSAIDKKINPIEILQIDKLSFNIPMQNSGTLRMTAVGIRQDIAGGTLNIRIAYQFSK